MALAICEFVIGAERLSIGASIKMASFFELQLEALGSLVSALGSDGEHGFRLAPGVSFESRSSGSGLGIYAKEVLAKGTVLVQVPFRRCLSVEAVAASPGLRRVFVEQAQLLNFPDEVLAIGLMYARLLIESSSSSAESFSLESCPWLLHAKTLPQSFNSTLFWEDDELLQLKGCTVFHLTQLMKRQIDADFQNVHAQLAEAYPELLGGITKDLYAWALSVIYSRAVGITRGGAYARIIPPVIDMANHDPHAAEEAADTFDFDEATDCLKFLAASDRAAGEECSAVYGRYPNSKLAYTYGFVIPTGNPHRCIDMWARVPASSYAADKKRLLLSSNSLTADQSYSFTGTLRPGWVSPALLATIRVIQINSQEELDVSARAFKGMIVSTRNEAATYASLLGLLQARVEADVAEAERAELGELLLSGAGDEAGGGRRLMALVIRCEERELVSECIGLVRRWVQELEAHNSAYVPPDADDSDASFAEV